jgi:Xaa-Pro aminopeptidase
MEQKYIRTRKKDVLASFKKNNIDSLLVTKPANVSYLTGFCGDDSWALITKNQTYLITDSRYTEQAQGECAGCKIIERDKAISAATAELINGIKEVKFLGIEKTASIACFEAVKKGLKKKISPVSSIVESVRVIKDADEIAIIKKASQIAAKALENVKKYFEPSITELFLCGLLELEIKKLGAAISFDTIVAFGANGSRPHHKPTIKKLGTNDSILIDFGVKYKNYCCDLTRCFYVGKPSELFIKSYRAAQHAQSQATHQIKSGVEIKKVDSIARETIKKYDVPVYGHGTGHGLGLEVHELPTIADKIEGKLSAGQIVTIEPGVYIPGKLGIRIEDDILVTENGFEILSGSCKQLRF